MGATLLPVAPALGDGTGDAGGVSPVATSAGGLSVVAVWSGVTVGDVCTIDWLGDPTTWLPTVLDMTPSQPAPATAIAVTAAAAGAADPCRRCSALRTRPLMGARPRRAPPKGTRSEERRVGKECRSR